MPTKYIILNEAGGALRNLPSAKFSDSVKNSVKATYFWTFSPRGCGDISKGEYSPTIKKALAHLESKGFTNLRVVPLDETIEAHVEEVKATKAIQSGKKQPRTNEEAREMIQQIAPDLLEDSEMYQGIQERCLACSHHCKQSLKAVLWDCPKFELIDKAAA